MSRLRDPQTWLAAPFHVSQALLVHFTEAQVNADLLVRLLSTHFAHPLGSQQGGRADVLYVDRVDLEVCRL